MTITDCVSLWYFLQGQWLMFLSSLGFSWGGLGLLMSICDYMRLEMEDEVWKWSDLWESHSLRKSILLSLRSYFSQHLQGIDSHICHDGCGLGWCPVCNELFRWVKSPHDFMLCSQNVLNISGIFFTQMQSDH